MGGCILLVRYLHWLAPISRTLQGFRAGRSEKRSAVRLAYSYSVLWTAFIEGIQGACRDFEGNIYNLQPSKALQSPRHRRRKRRVWICRQSEEPSEEKAERGAENFQAIESNLLSEQVALASPWAMLPPEGGWKAGRGFRTSPPLFVGLGGKAACGPA